jgi:uncharacterized protein YggE
MSKLRVVLWFGIASALCFSALGTAAADDVSPRIRVTGEGSANVAPDMAILELAVLREAQTARAALDANSAAMGEVLSSMGDLGVADRDLQTSNFSIQPKYTHPPVKSSGERRAPEIVGYKVRNSLTVRVRDISKVGEILDKSVSLGVNQGGNIRFTNDDPSAAITRARAEAVESAMAKANTLADAAGVDVGDILEISEQSYSPRPQPMARAEMMMASASDSVPIATGENVYKVVVSVTFLIEQ